MRQTGKFEAMTEADAAADEAAQGSFFGCLLCTF